MGMLKAVVLGRPNGIRAKIRAKIWALVRPPAPNAAPAAPREAQGGGVVAGGSRPSEPPKGVTPPEGFEVVLHRDALKPGEITEVILGGTAVAICNVEGSFFAVSNTCPHAGGPIGDGKLSGHTVTCPYHGWTYDVRDGKCFVNPDVTLPVFPTRVVGDAVCVQV
jgi:nitrite reductase/ring-hydroxylating ferredoxin subunit